ncbi:hypothetical protein GCM10023083_29130 [Streptomyces phyllanthi]
MPPHCRTPAAGIPTGACRATPRSLHGTAPPEPRRPPDLTSGLSSSRSTSLRLKDVCHGHRDRGHRRARRRLPAPPAEGLAAVRVRDKEADVIEKAGRAEAEATEARMRAEAEGARAKALAEAEGISGRLKAEAAGLTEKAAAMAALEDASRGHEEYRLRLEAEKDIRLAGLDVQRQVAEAQATVLATGLENADIDIVGGESVFFDRLVSSIALGKGVDGFVQHSQTAQALAQPWLDGTSSFTDDLSRVLGSVSTADVQNLTVSALLMKLMRNGGANAGQFQQLLDKAGELGLADTSRAALNGSVRA